MGRSWGAREGQATPIRPFPKPAWGLPLSSAPHAVPTAGQVRLLPLRGAARMEAATHPLLLAGVGAGPQRPPLPLGLPGEGPGAGGHWAAAGKARQEPVHGLCRARPPGRSV